MAAYSLRCLASHERLPLVQGDATSHRLTGHSGWLAVSGPWSSWSGCW
jgi:hypothetical protein